MSDTGHRIESRSGMKALQIARQRRGGVPKELMEYSREQARVRQKICEALGRGPMTVPEIHASTGIPADRVFWCLMAWKKYGKILESGQSGDYYRYALAHEERK
jgi:predicted Rossmann fold nucleotide-binding protein DprA/Smf involved in DNA uptake